VNHLPNEKRKQLIRLRQNFEPSRLTSKISIEPVLPGKEKPGP